MGFFNCNNCGCQVHTSRLPSNVCEKCEDVIKFPKHYNATEIQPIDVIEKWNLGFHLGNVVKYISRAGIKDPNKKIEDLKKANWYLSRYIESLEKNNDK